MLYAALAEFSVWNELSTRWVMQKIIAPVGANAIFCVGMMSDDCGAFTVMGKQAVAVDTWGVKAPAVQTFHSPRSLHALSALFTYQLSVLFAHFNQNVLHYEKLTEKKEELIKLLAGFNIL